MKVNIFNMKKDNDVLIQLGDLFLDEINKVYMVVQNNSDNRKWQLMNLTDNTFLNGLSRVKDDVGILHNVSLNLEGMTVLEAYKNIYEVFKRTDFTIHYSVDEYKINLYINE